MADIETALSRKDNKGANALLKKAARRLEHIDSQVSDIVAITKSRQAEPVFEEFRLQPVVESVFGRLGRLPGSKSMLLRNNISADTVLTNSKVHIEQIIENLVSNAIKFSDREKPTRFVEVSIEDIGDSQRITVIDNGLGIATDDRETMFQMFKRYHPDVAVGAGLGLYLVKQSAARIGGEVTYSPTPSGSRFMLKLSKAPRAR